MPAPGSAEDGAGPGRRTVLRGLVGGTAACAVPACARPPAAQPFSGADRLAGLTSILDFIPPALRAGVLAATDRTDLTDHVQAAFNSGARLWAPAEARFHVRSVTIAGTGRFFDLGNALFVGIATVPTTAVMVLTCAHSEIRGLRVAAGRSLLYRAAVHHFTSDANAHPVGYNRFAGGQVDGAAIGLLIGGLPEQRDFHAGRDPAGLAVDAPLSETTFVQWTTTGCVQGLHVNQPNGKVQLIGCHLAGETADWSAPDTPRAAAAAVVVGNPGSEVGIVGGSVEQLQERRGRFLDVRAGVLTIDAATVETIVSSYLAGPGRITLSRIAAIGFNSTTASVVRADAGATGSLTIAQSVLLMPPANSVSGSNDLVRGVDGFDGPGRASPGLLVDLANTELREPRWSGGGTGLYPLVRGARVMMRQCRLTRYTSDGLRRLVDVPIDDRDDRLAGVVDRSGSTLPALGYRPDAQVGGWRLQSGQGGRWGRGGDLGPAGGVRLAAAGAPVRATSLAFPVDRGRLFVLRARCRFAGSGTAALRVIWCDHAGSRIGEDTLFAGDPAELAMGDAAQWLALQVIPPPAAERAMLVLEVDRRADLTVAEPSVS